MLTLLLITGMTQHPVNKVHTIHRGVFFHGMEVEEEVLVLPEEVKRHILFLWVKLVGCDYKRLYVTRERGAYRWRRGEGFNRFEWGPFKQVVSNAHIYTVLVLTKT